MSNGSLMRDATIAKILSVARPKMKSLITFDNPHLSRILVDKLYFLSECKALSLEVPNFYLLQNSVELSSLYRKDQLISEDYRPYYIRSISASKIEKVNKGILNV